MSSDLHHSTLRPESEGSSTAQQLLAWLDACWTAERAPPSGDRLKAIQAIERRLAAIVPSSETDFFALVGRLQDKRLAPAARKAICANVAKAATLMASRWQRHLSREVVFALGASDLRKWQSEALDSLKKGAELLQAAESSLRLTDADDSTIVGVGVRVSMRGASEEIEDTMTSLVIGSIQFEDQMAKLGEISGAERTEAALFAEAASATAH